MKNILLITTFTIWTISLFAQDSTPTQTDSLSNTLVGVWEIDKTIDKEGKEVESISKKTKNSPLGNEIQIKATGPKMTLNQDASFELEFTPKNTDKGNWHLQNSNTLILQQITKKGTSSYNMLKTAAEMFGKTLNYDSDGNIVENNQIVIIKLEKEEMMIEYETDYRQVYRKKE
jgi:hypothetical protein